MAREGFVEVDRGTRLWYRVAGDGPVLAFQNGVGVTITFWEAMAARLAEKGYRTVLWDFRGHGRSDPARDPLRVDLETCAHDLVAVLDAVGAERAVLLGHSMGSQLGFEVFRLFRERVAALVPALGTYRDAVSTFWGQPAAAKALFSVTSRIAFSRPDVVRRFTALGVTWPALAELLARRLHIVHPTLSPKGWMPDYLRHTGRVDPRVFFALARAIQEHDATDLLPTVDVPTLVIAGDRDFFCPPKVAQEMARLVPDAELLVVPGGSHAALIEQPELIQLRLETFLEERVFPRAT